MAAKLLEVQQMPFFYSTKLGSQPDVHGEHISGAKDANQIVEFCRSNKVRLLIDAAHPFAVGLHQNIVEAAQVLDVKVVRIERRSPCYDSYAQTYLFSSYSEMANAAIKQAKYPILALTGVQTIEPLRELWSVSPCYFRILDTSQSMRIAKESGIDLKYIIQDTNPESESALKQLVTSLDAAVILTKDSGYSGSVDVKLSVAQALSIPLWVLSRPQLPSFDYTVIDRKELLQLLLKLKKELLTVDTLRSGFTTGTCVCAAVKAAIIALEEGAFPGDVTVYLPDGTPARFSIFPHSIAGNTASCSVIKDSGDDPDVTHGQEIGCTITRKIDSGVLFKRGVGVGVATLPGLQVAVGEPAINPGPRRMIEGLIQEMTSHYSISEGFIVEPFVPEGAVLARRTFNGRVGVEGGISILGTTGRIFPYSAEAFIGAIRQQVKVALSLGSSHIIATSGKRSETTLKPLCPGIPQAAYVHYGNFVGETIKAANEEGAKHITVGIMLGKAAKLAEGHLDTHSREVLLNPTFLVELAATQGYASDVLKAIEGLTLANALVDIIPFAEREPIYVEIARRCHQVCSQLVSSGVHIRLVLIVGESGIVVIG